jgi:hypothetical protein
LATPKKLKLKLMSQLPQSISWEKPFQLCNSNRFTKWKYEIYVHGLHIVKL